MSATQAAEQQGQHVLGVSVTELCGLYLASTHVSRNGTNKEASKSNPFSSTDGDADLRPGLTGSRERFSLDAGGLPSSSGSGSRLHSDITRSTDGAAVYVTDLHTCPLSRSGLEGIADDIDSVCFDQFVRLREEELVPTVMGVFDRLGLCQGLGVTREAMAKTVEYGMSLYHKQPAYHTQRHAFDVFQAAYILLKQSGLIETASHIEVFSLLITALFHDVGHPGLTNEFHIKEATSFAELAKSKQDSSDLKNPNEFCHSDITRRLLLCDAGLLPHGRFSEATRSQVDTLVQQLISATDPATQPAFLKRLDARLAKGEGLDVHSIAPDDRSLLLSLVIRCADVFHPLRPFHLHKRWALLFTHEISRETVLEHARRGQPLLKDPYHNLGAATIGFLNFLVIPLFRYLCRVFPHTHISRWVMPTLQAKLDAWTSYDRMRERRVTALQCR